MIIYVHTIEALYIYYHEFLVKENNQHTEVRLSSQILVEGIARQLGSIAQSTHQDNHDKLNQMIQQQ